MCSRPQRHDGRTSGWGHSKLDVSKDPDSALSEQRVNHMGWKRKERFPPHQVSTPCSPHANTPGIVLRELARTSGLALIRRSRLHLQGANSAKDAWFSKLSPNAQHNLAIRRGQVLRPLRLGTWQ